MSFDALAHATRAATAIEDRYPGAWITEIRVWGAGTLNPGGTTPHVVGTANIATRIPDDGPRPHCSCGQEATHLARGATLCPDCAAEVAEPRPDCDVCGDEIEDDVLAEGDDDLLCLRCLDLHRRRGIRGYSDDDSFVGSRR